MPHRARHAVHAGHRQAAGERACQARERRTGEHDDIRAIIGRLVGAQEFAAMVIDQFDEMLEQSQAQPLVMGVALHAMITGQPFRLRALRRAFQRIASRRERIWLSTAGAIAGHFAAA